jgi:peptide-methionine (R)-S-oxide reductase
VSGGVKSFSNESRITGKALSYRFHATPDAKPVSTFAGVALAPPPAPDTDNEEEPPMAEASFPVAFSDAEWRERLTAEQYAVMRGHGTERPGSCALLYEKRAGRFSCAGCGNVLFVSRQKFESGTGWPSFGDPEPGAVASTIDRSHGMVRTEVHCARCGSHLGHVFDDGPPPSGLRYCINGVALDFAPDP